MSAPIGFVHGWYRGVDDVVTPNHRECERCQELIDTHPPRDYRQHLKLLRESNV